MFDPAVYNVWHKAASCQTLPSVLKKNHWDQANLHAVCNLAFIWTGLLKNWSMFSARISSYGCTWEVWRAREKRKSCLRRSREQLLLLQCSRNSIIAEWKIGNPLNGFLSFFSFFFFFFIFLFSLLRLFFFLEEQKHFIASCYLIACTVMITHFLYSGIDRALWEETKEKQTEHYVYLWKVVKEWWLTETVFFLS